MRAPAALPAAAPRGQGGVPLWPLVLHLFTFEVYALGFVDEAVAVAVAEQLRANASYAKYEDTAAFQVPLDRQRQGGPRGDGWRLYDAVAEFKRQGVGERSHAWRVSGINEQYTFSPTYPATLLVPSRISDATLQYACKYRSKARIPALTYLHWANGASITRSSQPMVGLKQSRSVHDEKLVESIFASHRDDAASGPASTPLYGATTTNLVIDARPTVNAMANFAMGAGTENMENYRAATKTHLGIENIHVMRDSLDRVAAALRGPLPRGDEDGAAPPRAAAPDQLALRRSNWLRHLSAILDGTALIVRNVHVNASHVLVHCSDGWDRTAQLTSLAQLCLDPYFRTAHGLAVLVEKDWLSFGHRFGERLGVLQGAAERYELAPPTAQREARSAEAEAADDDAPLRMEAVNAFWGGVRRHLPFQAQNQQSPIFFQFLDAVAQLQHQFPERFAFNVHFLAALHREAYAGRTGSFLYNCEGERRAAAHRTPSVWDLLPPEDPRWRNARFDPALDDPKRPGGDMGVLIPDAKRVRFTPELLHHTDAELNSLLDRDALEQQLLQQRLEKAALEAPDPLPEPRPQDESFEAFHAAASRMRSFFSNGWGRFQDALRNGQADDALAARAAPSMELGSATRPAARAATEHEPAPPAGTAQAAPPPGAAPNPWADARPEPAIRSLSDLDASLHPGTGSPPRAAHPRAAGSPPATASSSRLDPLGVSEL